jgi:hypothetical protein
MTDEEIISSVLEDDNSENEQESCTLPIILTVWQDDAMSAFNPCYKWAKENNMQAENILTLNDVNKW